MKQYYTLEQFNQIFKEKLNEHSFEDGWSRTIVKKLLKDHFITETDIIQDTIGKKWDDLVVNTEKGNIGVEVKYRYAGRYDTHIVNNGPNPEDRKYDGYLNAIKRGDVKRGVIISIWWYGEIWLTNMANVDHIDTKRQNISTNADKRTDGIKTEKINVHFKPDVKYYICIVCDDRNNICEPYISKTPIDVNELNRIEQSNIELF